MKSSNNQKLTEIPDATLHSVLSQIARYRLATFATVQQLEVFEDQGPRFVKAAIKECERRKWIASAWLDGTRKYWFLHRRGADILSLDNPRIGPLSQCARIRAAGMLFFCLLGTRQRHLLTRSECQQHLKDELRGGLPSGYYFMPDESCWLGLARIDAGRLGRWDRVIESVREDVDRHLRMETLKPLIKRRGFEISVVTVLPEKAVRLKDAMSSLRDLRRIPVRVVVCSELLPLLAPGPHRKGR